MTVIYKKCSMCNQEYKSSTDVITIGTRIRICNSGNLWFNCVCDSTLFLKKGNYDWLNIEDQLSSEARKIYVQNKGLETIPKIQANVMELQEVVENPNNSFDVIKKEMDLHPTIAIIVLNMASNLNPQGEEINDLKHAMSILGRTVLSNLILSSSLANIELKSKLYKIHSYWQEALTTGSISRYIYLNYSNDFDSELVDRVYISGCFCQVGKLMGSIFFPDKIDEIFNLVSNPQTMTTWEKAVKITNTPSMVHLAEIASVHWGLPRYVKNVALYFDDIIQFDNNNGKLEMLECIQFSHLLYHWLNSSPHLIDVSKLQHFQKRLNINDQGLESIVKDVSGLKEKIDTVMDNLF